MTGQAALSFAGAHSSLLAAGLTRAETDEVMLGLKPCASFDRAPYFAVLDVVRAVDTVKSTRISAPGWRDRKTGEN